MNTYHVLLLYPEYIANYYGESYLSDLIQAESIQEAVAQARYDCALSNEQPEGWADDFTVILVVREML